MLLPWMTRSGPSPCLIAATVVDAAEAAGCLPSRAAVARVTTYLVQRLKGSRISGHLALALGPIGGEDLVSAPPEQQVESAAEQLADLLVDPFVAKRERQPPSWKPPVGSSVGPPGACITPSSDRNAAPIILRIGGLAAQRRFDRGDVDLLIVIIASNARLAAASSGLFVAFEQARAA